MIEEFLSVVVPLGPDATPDRLARLLDGIRKNIATRFWDYEIILVDYGSTIDFNAVEIDAELRDNCYLVRLTRTAIWDQAALAGVERANGDRCVILDTVLADHTDIVLQMREAALAGGDIVGLRNPRNRVPSQPLSRRLFFLALRHTASVGVGPRDRREFLISRRALNWIVRDSTVHWYLNEAFAASGFQIRWLEKDLPLTMPRARQAGTDLAWAVLVRSPQFLRTLSKVLIGGLLLILVLVVLNTLSVRFFGHDLVAQPQVTVPGWAYIVMLMSAGFAAVAGMLYLVLTIQLVLLEQLRARPRYIVEYFGRI